LRNHPYRTPPDAPRDDADVPAVVPVTILAVLLGVLIAFFAPRRVSDPADARALFIDAPSGHFAPRR
jgi:hypothetical protein